jgi:hypothetical protein
MVVDAALRDVIERQEDAWRKELRPVRFQPARGS